MAGEDGGPPKAEERFARQEREVANTAAAELFIVHRRNRLAGRYIQRRSGTIGSEWARPDGLPLFQHLRNDGLAKCSLCVARLRV
jgi:hypothetical protein